MNIITVNHTSISGTESLDVVMADEAIEEVDRPRSVLRPKKFVPPRDGCSGLLRYNYFGKDDDDCEYGAPFECDRCIYVYQKNGIKGGYNPQAKRWQKCTLQKVKLEIK